MDSQVSQIEYVKSVIPFAYLPMDGVMSYLILTELEPEWMILRPLSERLST